MAIPQSDDEKLAELDTTPVPRFDLSDKAEWLEYFEQEGFVVIQGMVAADELEESERLFWEFLEENTNMTRDDPGTWSDREFSRVNRLEWGLMNGGGLGQSDFQWYMRTRPKIRQAFEAVWDETDLLVSFDGGGAFLPWNHGFRRTDVGWWHVDQGPAKQGRHAVQGLVSVYDADATTGGLTVVPGSHHRHAETVANFPYPNHDFVMVDRAAQIMQELPKRLVCCHAGDLVLWDSRTIHANAPAPVRPTCPDNRLLRAVSYICMVPARFAPQWVRESRRIAYEQWVSTSHWPQDFAEGSQNRRKQHRSLADATAAVQALVG